MLTVLNFSKHLTRIEIIGIVKLSLVIIKIIHSSISLANLLSSKSSCLSLVRQIYQYQLNMICHRLDEPKLLNLISYFK